MRRFGQALCCVLVMAVIMFVLSGCNTWSGVGKDIQRSGEAIEGSAE